MGEAKARLEATKAEFNGVDMQGSLREGPAPSMGERQTLFHYTSEKGLEGILNTKELRPSLKEVNPSDARYGNGQYLTDIVPGTKTPAQLSQAFVRRPFFGSRYTHYVEVDVTDLNVIQGRPNVFVIPNELPLDISQRIIGYGKH